MTTSGLLLVDGAAATDEGEYESSDGSPPCGASCYPSKLTVDSGQLEFITTIVFMVSSMVGGGGRICRCDILW